MPLLGRLPFGLAGVAEFFQTQPVLLVAFMAFAVLGVGKILEDFL